MITVFHGPDPYAAGHLAFRAALPILGEGFFCPISPIASSPQLGRRPGGAA